MLSYQILKAYAEQDKIVTVTQFNLGEKIAPEIITQNHFPVTSEQDVLNGIINMARTLEQKHIAIPTCEQIVNGLQLNVEVEVK